MTRETQADPVAEALRGLADHWEKYRDVGELQRVLACVLECAAVAIATVDRP